MLTVVRAFVTMLAMIGAFALWDRAQSSNDAMDVNVRRVGGVAVSGGGVLTGTWTDNSGSITSGGASQTAIASNTSRKRYLIENPCTATSQGIATAESLFVNFTAAAAANTTSVELAACGSIDSAAGPVTTEAITVLGNTTSHKFIAKELN